MREERRRERQRDDRVQQRQNSHEASPYRTYPLFITRTYVMISLANIRQLDGTATAFTSSFTTMSSFAKALSPAVREIRILCCQTGAASAGTR